MKLTPLFAFSLLSGLIGGAAQAEGFPWKTPIVETEARANFALLPSAQVTFRYGSPTELADAHALSLFLGPKLKLSQDDGAAWILPQIGVRAMLGTDSDFQTLVSIWGKFSMLDRSVSYQFMADLAITLPLEEDGFSVDVRHLLDYNIVIPTGTSRGDDGWSWHGQSNEADPWKREHCLLQFGLHAQHRNQYLDIGPAISTKYQWLRVSLEYLLGFQDENRGQTFRIIVGTDLNI